MKQATNESEEAAARRLTEELGAPKGRITRQSVRTWRQKGYPLNDPEGMLRALRAQPRTPSWLIDKEVAQERDHAVWIRRRLVGQTLKVEAEAEIKKTEAEIKKIEADAAREKWVTNDELHEQGRQLGAIVRSHLLQIPNQWAPVLEGKTAAQMRSRMREDVGRILREFERLTGEKSLPSGGKE